ncbi:multicopper oxidase domain-containing protein [Chitinophaga horti]|uniref:Multicopper oxidase domain-containing protein n=1 Tax=Chitinophaga horti TaxID=2920382 RepID=A0ABY6J791_9BACT|nr:multicopper oxidase domain-containing protein [Chitinophaga horti]UYQ95350.1 multicopper oxidase domain-containing protein [Chitinophaga horti]
MSRILITALWLFAVLSATAQRTVTYHLYVKDTMVNYTGKTRMAYAVNGQIPMPALHFTEGDTAEIYIHNELHTETSIHWHGLILPNNQDGVPYLTTAPIKPHTVHTYRFPLVQNGTYWYHSHTALQEQSGMYGAFIIHKKDALPAPEYTLVLSDWTDMHPHQVERRLKMATDWFSIKKGQIKKGVVQSYGEAIAAGHFKTKVANEWKRMEAMDVSDVYYERFHANGRDADSATEFRPGQKVRVRVINGSSSTYFWLTYAGGKINVIANDGMDVVPVPVDRLIIATAETYDLELTLPADSAAVELLATAEDRTRSTSLWLGKGVRQAAQTLPPLKYFEGMKMMNSMMKMNGHLDDMGMKMSLQQMDMNAVMYREPLADIKTLNYAMLRSPVKTTLPDAPVKELKFTLTGNMNRYVWSIDNRTVSESDKIIIKKGENVRLILYNNSMMRHPMHLHGHFFRVLNGQGDYAPLKNTLDIMPMETDTLEFAATDSGDWYFHCHILYHMMSGMGRIFQYEDSPENPAQQMKKVYADDRMFHFMAQNDFATNGNDGEAVLQNTRWSFQAEWRLGYRDMHGYEVETHFGRYMGQMQRLLPYVGIDWRYRKMEPGEKEKNLFGQVSTKNERRALCAGLQYTLPMLAVLDARIDTDGKARVSLMREDIRVTSRLRLGFMVNTDKEYMAGLRYVLTPFMGVSAHYDSDMGLGAGITLNY